MPSTRLHRPRARTVGLVLAALAVGTGLAACGAGASTSATTSGSSGSGPSGTAQVAYAGSLTKLAETVLGPAFEHATGDAYSGRGAGSTALAQEIISGEISPGVFLSVGRDAIDKLEPAHSKFALELATDPLVVAYNPKSPFAPELAAVASGKAPLSSLFGVLARPGFKLGRTDPNADPQGVTFVLMVKLAQKLLHLPSSTVSSVLGITTSNPSGNTSQVFDETAVLPTLQAGELDASSAFVSQAIQYHLPYIKLPAALDFADAADSALYGSVSLPLSDGTVLAGSMTSLNETLVLPPPTSAGDRLAAERFCAFLVSPGGRSELAAGGYDLVSPLFFGAQGETPRSALGSVLLSAFERAGGVTATG